MRPLNDSLFGADGIAVIFYNGSDIVPGYIVRQASTNTFWVTDGDVDPVRVKLATSADIAADLAAHPEYCLIAVDPPEPDATGATFHAHYGVDHATVVSGGSNFVVGNVLNFANGAVQVASVSGSAVATVTISDAGNYTDTLASNPQTGTRIAGSGATFVPHYTVHTSTTLAAGGTGYALNDTITLASTGGAVITVDGIDNITGAVVAFHVSNAGTGVTGPFASDPRSQSATSGSGTGATFHAKYKLSTVTISAGGTGYQVGQTLAFGGLVATTAPTAHVSAVSSGAATTVVVDTAGTGITTAATAVTVNTATATFNLTYKLLSVAASGGSGYNVGDPLVFNGMVANTLPTAHVNSTGAATSVVVDSQGSGITSPATSFSAEEVTYVQRIWSKRLRTIDGLTEKWSLGESVNGALVVPTFGG